MTVGELKKLLAQHEDDTLLLKHTSLGEFRLTTPDEYLYDGEDLFDFDEAKIDPGHLRKVLVF